MFNPSYRVLIAAKCFPRDGVIGLGKQLISIINSAANYLPPHHWYGTDIEAIGKNLKKKNLKKNQVSLIGNDLQFAEYCSQIDQFIWGVFLCVGSDSSSQDIKDIEIETEDAPFRPINIDGVICEIRAFDTTYFEVYSDDFGLIKSLSKVYNVEIEKRFQSGAMGKDESR